MKKEIFEGLKTKFEGVQDAILNRMAEKLAKTVTDAEGVATAVAGVTYQQLLESYGDSRATEATQTAITNYEKKHNLKDGAKVDERQEGGAEPGKAGTNPPPGDEVPAWAKSVIEVTTKLANDIAEIKGEKVVNTRTSLFTKAVETAPEKIRDRYTKDFNRMSFKDDEEFNAWLQEVQTDIIEFVNDLSVSGVTFSSPKKPTGAGDEKPSAEVQARVDKRNAEKADPAIKGMPENK